MRKTILLLLAPLLGFVAAAQTDSSIQVQPPFQPLAVQQLEAKVVDNSVQLTWNVTANEEARSFDVERSEDGTVFRKIGGRLASGKQGRTAYEFVDALPKKNVLYTYRVRLNSRDGASITADAAVAKVEEARLQCRLKQNPVRHHIEVDITAASATDVVATVVTGFGQKQASETIRLSTGLNRLSLSSQNLPAGLHRLVLETGNERQVFSFVKE